MTKEKKKEERSKKKGMVNQRWCFDECGQSNKATVRNTVICNEGGAGTTRYRLFNIFNNNMQEENIYKKWIYKKHLKFILYGTSAQVCVCGTMYNYRTCVCKFIGLLSSLFTPKPAVALNFEKMMKQMYPRKPTCLVFTILSLRWNINKQIGVGWI